MEKKQVEKIDIRYPDGEEETFEVNAHLEQGIVHSITVFFEANVILVRVDYGEEYEETVIPFRTIKDFTYSIPKLR
jgi:hypothetical protein